MRHAICRKILPVNGKRTTPLIRIPENLGYYYGRRVEWFRRNMDSGNYTEGTWDGTGTEGMSAGQYLDLIELMAQELESRGDYPVPGQPTADELRAQFNSAIGC